MPIVSLGSSQSFVSGAKLKIPKTEAFKGLMAGKAAAVGDAGGVVDIQGSNAQALIAGSGLMLAENGVSAQTKQDIVSCTLFAQFYASGRVLDPSRVVEWYSEYFRALNQIGFATASQDFQEYKAKGNTLRVHKEILGTLAILLGPAATGLAVAKAVLSGLESIENESGWLTLFDSRTVLGKASRFQVVSAQPVADGIVNIALVGFELRSKNKVTKVLFFESKKASVRLRYAGGIATIYEPVLSGVRDQLRHKLAAISTSFVNSVQIPETP